MTNGIGTVNSHQSLGTIAPLSNVALFTELMDRVVNRPRHLPGLGTFHGFSGYGKTFSATYAANTYRALHVEVGASWTLKKFCQSVLRELGFVEGRRRQDANAACAVDIMPRTIPDMVEKIIEALAIEERPLIIDEFDHVTNWGEKSVNVIREILDKSQAAIILIGEEALPNKLQTWERVHNRVLDWVPAQPANAEDTQILAQLYCPGLDVAGDLAERITRLAEGRVRRICVNLERVREFAASSGLSSVDLSAWGDRPLWTGRPPARRG